MTTIRGQLEALGFTPNQSEVYLALFRLKEAKAGEIIKKTGLHRNLVYGALEELVKKKLISLTRIRGIALYKALSSTRLLGEVQEKERLAKGVIEELSLLSKGTNSQEIIVYEGIDEFRKHVLHSLEVAKKGDLIRYLGTSPHWHTVVGKEIEDEAIRIQKEKKIRQWGIAKSSFPALKPYLEKTKNLNKVKINPLISSETNNIEILNDKDLHTILC